MKNKKEHKRPVASAKKQHSGTLSLQNGGNIGLLIILLITLIVYLPALSNHFAWDDDGYILNDPLIYSFSLKNIFSTYIMGNYHPLTMLVYSIEYIFFGMKPGGYHLINVLFHLLNTALVFYVTLRLSDKKEIALVVSLLFGIHPMHVESVAWISELKDLLYTLFFLLSALFYLKYIKAGERRFYVYSVLLFLLSLLSKGMAVSLPVVLILIDYFKGRKLNAKIWIEKVPYFVLAVIFGIVAVHAQKTNNSIQDTNLFPFINRVILACYGYVNYILKIIVPVKLSAFYAYPIKGNQQIPILFSLYPLAVIGIAAFTFYSLKNSKKIFFGVAFFSATIFLVLQLLPVGNVIMSDRYSYVPSIGIFYLLAEGFYYLWNRKNERAQSNRRMLAYAILAIVAIFYSVSTYARCRVWKDDLALWSDVIEKNSTSAFAYYNRGLVYKNKDRLEEGINDFTKAIQVQPNFHEAYNNRANLLAKLKLYDQALEDYNRTVKYKPDYAEAYYNRALVYIDLKKDMEALQDLEKNISLKPDHVDAYINLAIIMAGQDRTEEAFKYYTKAIELKPRNVEAYYNRGNLYKKLQRNEDALNDYTKAIEFQPDLYDAYNNRGLVLMKEKKYDEAIRDYNKAIELRPGTHYAYFNRGIAFTNKKQLEEAINDYSKAIELKPNYTEAYYNRGMAEYFAGKKDAACLDFQQAAGMGFPLAIEAYNKFCR